MCKYFASSAFLHSLICCVSTGHAEYFAVLGWVFLDVSMKGFVVHLLLLLCIHTAFVVYPEKDDGRLPEGKQ